jgi:hypothetical protein
MVWAEVAKLFSGNGHETVNDGQHDSTLQWNVPDTRRTTEVMDEAEAFEALRPPYIHVCAMTEKTARCTRQ